MSRFLSEPPQAILATTALVVGTWRNVMFARWRATPSRQDVTLLREQLAVFTRRHPRFAGCNFVNAHNATSFAADVRADVEAIRREFGSQQIAIATVIEGTGFWASTVRSIAAGMTMLSRESFPSKNFDTLDPAIAWLAPMIGCSQAPDLPLFRAAVEAFREMDPAPTKQP